jgi:hypothetical protein
MDELKRKIAIWILRRKRNEHLKMRRHILSLRMAIHKNSSSLEKVVTERETLWNEASAHFRAAEKIERLLQKHENNVA